MLHRIQSKVRVSPVEKYQVSVSLLNKVEYLHSHYSSQNTIRVVRGNKNTEKCAAFQLNFCVIPNETLPLYSKSLVKKV